VAVSLARPAAAAEEVADGFFLLRRFLDRAAQAAALAACARVAAAAPFITPTMPDGTPFRVAMTNAGEWGWLSDKNGYRYDRRHPETGALWPPAPAILCETAAQAVAAALGQAAAAAYRPQCFLINRYAAGSGRLGLHQDRDERDRTQPIVTLSLGADAVFLAGGARRAEPKQRVLLASGDVLVMGGPGRMAYHGIDRLLPTLGALMPDGSRLSVTLRRVDPVA
jgi:alkylated DNA repair protein (DNA oxidative demethylase)